VQISEKPSIEDTMCCKCIVQRMLTSAACVMYAITLQHNTNPGSYDYSKPFKLFDESGDGVIPIDELRKMLYKLNIDSLLRENQVVELMNRFDSDRTGVYMQMYSLVAK
jgi:Ca2+-binding EF-hand superfamily protein